MDGLLYGLYGGHPFVVRIWRGNHVLVVGTSLPLSTTVLLASGPLVLSPPRAMTYANTAEMLLSIAAVTCHVQSQHN
jgi:hypothetical protein